ncbi:MAG: hypothetical protein A2268_12755 [Candidatus Raymondbacteria bacterium RifOxyA12_full_50_37]|uniref:Radical SAM core domain-containing protein n=1 Tax=Candidatus Raymondbacteria bacterium RIFOXYD12_FULL_49_13 TaxID=1817890 RepID=A0A1F7F3L2_UNCRA|nr:MAG: hypothetical protein A2268_12755 [Candidatus Raymondbacteria bacterium RifOxyA12_full_50_37]OGJ90794.1 MAG: hypothetical protein A2248_02235 [Candidatus Raymondbacteria bacterium RIFOXYA2_FULL_49_16]OGJ96327.1 MAG: hypothetical protein A2350_03715 [Candidatus Raymondbacteria bacterium RifOxyB12_full_50_8]OGJ97361.1 MAG: hypothetical protein A2453_03515 [Candidatus Raymondbacteria bacterium RIFOXYC2_FULL_50_21]OGK01260.1 MAG: hypothetical protein A2519_02780 [Candidatus Raymondbacteria b
MLKPSLVVADSAGRAFDLAGYQALGMKGTALFSLRPEELVPLPLGSTLMSLPKRIPLGLNRADNRVEALSQYTPVGVFIAPGWTGAYNTAYRETRNPPRLPLYSYTAVCWYKSAFHIAAIRVEKTFRHHAGHIDARLVEQRVRSVLKTHGSNRIITQLALCAREYGCAGAQNFFLGKYECPLPSSPFCNARCRGCISLQPAGCCPAPQSRITFTPTPRELAETALFHIQRVPGSVASFGQGCEGEPLMSAHVIEQAIRIIRQKTRSGILNMNTNAGKPRDLERLLDVGLDSIRVSMNSVQKAVYEKYFRPKNYCFSDVLKSIRMAKNKGKFVSINYLVSPGFTDSGKEVKAFLAFCKKYQPDMIQWRNHNYDPLLYARQMGFDRLPARDMLGIRKLIALIRRNFPAMRHGYYNPARWQLSDKRDPL